MVTIAGAVVAGATAAAAAVLALASSYDVRCEGATCEEAVVSPAPAPAQAPAQECAVCLSELAGASGCSESEASSSAVRTLPGCGHGFHARCIGRWLPLRPECPLCRRPVMAEVTAECEQATTAEWSSRPARMACGFGDGRVVWTRSPSVRQ